MRRSVDTNVLVRALVDDGSEQATLAAACLTRGVVHVPTTVVLETEWVLRARFGASRSVISQSFGKLLGMENVVFDRRSIVANAVAAHGVGLDFADALHLYGAGESDAFISFDQGIQRRAAKIADAVPVISPRQDSRSQSE